MDSLVLELQQLARSAETGIGELLRHAKVVAVKLDLEDARVWIDQEINGYVAQDDVPPYRDIPSELQVRNPFHGWNAVAWGSSGNLQEHFATFKVGLAIAEVEVAAKSKRPGFALTQPEMDALMQASDDFGRLPAMRSVSRASLVGILESVRAKVLDWSLALEKRGVLGHGMTFNEKEKRDAAGVPLRLDDITTIVLFLSANPDPKSPLKVEKEQNRIVKVRNGSKHQSKVRIEGLPDLDLPEFAKSLRLHSPTIVHFSGHGAADGSLVMRDENRKTREMAPTGLAKLVALQKSTIRLVILNACYSDKLAKLLVADIECVIGMTAAVSDAAAILFAQTFYSALFDGKTVGESFKTSAATIEATYDDEKDVPILMAKPGTDPDQLRLVE
jgi:hypothetical protein